MFKVSVCFVDTSHMIYSIYIAPFVAKLPYLPLEEVADTALDLFTTKAHLDQLHAMVFSLQKGFLGVKGLC